MGRKTISRSIRRCEARSAPSPRSSSARERRAARPRQHAAISPRRRRQAAVLDRQHARRVRHVFRVISSRRSCWRAACWTSSRPPKAGRERPSIAGSRVHPFAGTAYATSKRRSPRSPRWRRFGPLGIRVNAIAPGRSIPHALAAPKRSSSTSAAPARTRRGRQDHLRAVHHTCPT